MKIIEVFADYTLPLADSACSVCSYKTSIRNTLMTVIYQKTKKTTILFNMLNKSFSCIRHIIFLKQTKEIYLSDKDPLILIIFNSPFFNSFSIYSFATQIIPILFLKNSISKSREASSNFGFNVTP